MKNKSLNFSTLFVFIVAISLFLNSCKKESTPLQSTNVDDLANLNYKDLTLSDINGENSIIMRISSEDASLLDYYTESNFIIIPIKDGQEISAAVRDYYELYPIQEKINGNDLEDDFSDSVEEDISVNMVVIKKNLNEGIYDVAITVVDNDTSDERARFKTVHHYSQNQEDKVYVERTSWCHRVWAGITKQTYSDGPWTTVLRYDKLANHDPHEFTNHDAYKYDLKVRRRKSKHYTYAFTE